MKKFLIIISVAIFMFIRSNFMIYELCTINNCYKSMCYWGENSQLFLNIFFTITLIILLTIIAISLFLNVIDKD